MDYNVKDVEKEFMEQTKKINDIEEQIKASYEERILINEITEFLQQNRDLEAEIEKCNKQIVEVDSYNLSGLKNEKKSAIEKLRKLKEYKKYLEENEKENTDKKELMQQLKVENIKRTNDYLTQKNEILSITRNLIDVCEETITDLEHENGKSVDLSKLFSEFEAVEKEIKSFDKYNNILSKKNALYLEQLKMQKQKVMEQLKDKLPDLGRMIVDSVKQDLYEEEREKVLKIKQDNNEKINQFKELNKKLQEFDKDLRKNKFLELTKIINEQEKNIIKIKINKQNAEQEKTSEPVVENEIPEYITKKVSEILSEPVQELSEQELPSKNLNEFNVNEANNFKRMNVNDFIKQRNNEVQEDNKEKEEPVLSPEIIAAMDNVVNNIDKEPENRDIQTPVEEKTGAATNEDIQKYLFSGEDAINPEYTDKYAEVVERIKQERKPEDKIEKPEAAGNKKENITEIRYKSELQNIRNYLNKKENKSEEIEKKVKRKTLKEKFNNLGKKVLKKIGDWLLEEVEFEEENALLEESIKEEKGRSK